MQNNKTNEQPFFSSDDTKFGCKFVYCSQHLRVHSTGWCTVSCLNKVALLSETIEEANREWEMKKVAMRL